MRGTVYILDAQSDVNLKRCDGERWRAREKHGSAVRKGGRREGGSLDSWDSKAVTVKVLR